MPYNIQEKKAEENRLGDFDIANTNQSILINFLNRRIKFILVPYSVQDIYNYLNAYLNNLVSL